MKIELNKGETYTRFFTQELEPYVSQTSLDGIGAVIALVGELGAGKSTLTRHLARHLGVSQKLPSPTFVLLKEYDIFPERWGKNKLVHIDAYRIQNAEEIVTLGIDKMFGNSNILIVIEWANNVENLIPPHAAWFFMNSAGEHVRTIENIKK